MTKLYTIPDSSQIEQVYEATPVKMRPNKLPFAFVGEEYLSPDECNAILDSLMEEERYHTMGCDADFTIEAPSPLPNSLESVIEFAKQINVVEWGYDLDDDPYAWLQTYGKDNYYQMHTDTYPGQMRKLTAVVMLTEETAYLGGDLILHTWPYDWQIERKQGTIVIFQPWILHEVTPILSGRRQTLNVGFYGPPFK